MDADPISSIACSIYPELRNNKRKNKQGFPKLLAQKPYCNNLIVLKDDEEQLEDEESEEEEEMGKLKLAFHWNKKGKFTNFGLFI
ncbi:hypothetical protein BLOT_003495 [Blomia tropicalis]|nr:hypothetical protein BLOT_003495 [Blomia tropicalis]